MEPDAPLLDDAIRANLFDAGWRRGARVPSALGALKFTFALRLDNMDAMTAELMRVSSPDSAGYGQHWSLEEVVDHTVAPERLARVLDALKMHLPHASVTVLGGGMFVELTGVSAGEAEVFFAARLHVYEHASGVRTVRSATGYALPDELAADVSFVGGLTRLPNTAPAPARRADEPDVALAVTPRLIRNHYGIGHTVGDGSSSVQAVAQFLGQRCGEADLDVFRTLFADWAWGMRPTYIGPDTGPAGTEACLDLEYIVGVGAHVPTLFWATGGTVNNQEPFLEWIVNGASRGESRPRA